MRIQTSDVRASIVVFLVALPLCVGIALASNAPLSAGIFAGIIGGIVIGILGGSSVAVSGPTAGLTVIVASSITQLGNYPAFAGAVVLAGCLQLIMGFLKAGELGNFFPASVIKGMLAAIGLILILKQIPHMFGWDVDYMGDESFGNFEGVNTFTEIVRGWESHHWGAVIVSVLTITVVLLWERILQVKWPKLSRLPSPLVAVASAIAVNEWLFAGSSNLEIVNGHLVKLPFAGGFAGIFGEMALPDMTVWSNPLAWKIALSIAVFSSLESLLTLDASEKIDPLKRVTRKNKELRALGFGNLLSGMIGGLPIASVLVRTSANVRGGGLHPISAILHGTWILLAVLCFPNILNRIPLASLAAILVLVGFRLCSPQLFRQQWRMGMTQFIPFIVTVLAILFTDLLVGIGIGLVVGMIYVLKSNSHSSIMKIQLDEHTLVRFCKDVSFLQKNRLRAILRDLPDNGHVVIDGSRSVYIDHDIVELVEDFMCSAPSRNINVRIQKSPLALCDMFKGNI